MKSHILPQVGAPSSSSHSRYHARSNIFTAVPYGLIFCLRLRLGFGLSARAVLRSARSFLCRGGTRFYPVSLEHRCPLAVCIPVGYSGPCRLGRGPTGTTIACPSGGRWHRPPVALAQSGVASPARCRPNSLPRPPLGLRGHPGSRSPGAGLLERGAYGRHGIREAGSDERRQLNVLDQ
jgi:hypothetical protein